MTGRSRFYQLEGARNVRDLGGCPAAGGRRVRRGRFVRAGDIQRLTEGDLEALAGLPLRTVVDFRRPEERLTAPDRLPATVELTENLPLEDGAFDVVAALKAGSTEELLVEVNRTLVRSGRPVFRRFFQLAAEEGRAALMFHCSAGKDRTGLAAMLLLTALGADRETVMEDYLLSNPGLGDKYRNLTDLQPEIQPLVEARPAYLEAAFETLDREFGGAERYLKEELGADLDRLREMHLE